MLSYLQQTEQNKRGKVLLRVHENSFYVIRRFLSIPLYEADFNFGFMFNIALLRNECFEEIRKGLVFRSVFRVFDVLLQSIKSMRHKWLCQQCFVFLFP